MDSRATILCNVQFSVLTRQKMQLIDGGNSNDHARNGTRADTRKDMEKRGSRSPEEHLLQ